MKEIIIYKNDSNQRIDRFLNKFMPEASKTLIYKSLRKKNITLNGKKVSPEVFLEEGDKIQIYFSDQTIEKFRREEKRTFSSKPKIIYEDENIALINKNKGLLSHNDQKVFQKNALDMFVDYLIFKEEYNPRLEKSFRPAICNRLDRNTSGILIGAKNAEALREINFAIKNRHVDKFYLTLVKGKTPDFFEDRSYMVKDEKKNLVSIFDKEKENGKLIETHFKTLSYANGYSLLEVKLITGRTHQIRASLNHLGYKIVGDPKYGFADLNLRSQFLHNYKLVFHNLKALDYLNEREFICPLEDIYEKVLQKVGVDYKRKI